MILKKYLPYFEIQRTFNMNTQEQLNHLSEISSLMERSIRCLSLRGLSGVSAGIIAIMSGIYTWWYLGNGSFEFPISITNYFLSFSTKSQFFGMVVILTIVQAVSIAFFFTTRNSRKKGIEIWDTSTKYFLINLSILLDNQFVNRKPKTSYCAVVGSLSFKKHIDGLNSLIQNINND